MYTVRDLPAWDEPCLRGREYLCCKGSDAEVDGGCQDFVVCVQKGYRAIVAQGRGVAFLVEKADLGFAEGVWPGIWVF